jgi:hypothetical protein
VSVINKLDSKVKKFGSKQSENQDIETLEAQISDQMALIDAKTLDIGQFYWNLYAEDKFNPQGDAVEMFQYIEECLKRIESFDKDIKARKSAGEGERQQIEANLNALEAEKAKENEERKQKQAADRAQKKAEKAAEKAEAAEKARQEAEAAKAEAEAAKSDKKE